MRRCSRKEFLSPLSPLSSLLSPILTHLLTHLLNLSNTKLVNSSVCQSTVSCSKIIISAIVLFIEVVRRFPLKIIIRLVLETFGQCAVLTKPLRCDCTNYEGGKHESTIKSGLSLGVG